MITLWRTFIWIIGSLSVALLLARAHNLTLSPPVQTILNAYDQIVGFAVRRATPWVADLAQLFDATVGTGATLLPHWSHIFLLATLHMLPSMSATYGMADARASLLSGLQIMGAILAGGLIAAFVGSQPFLVEGNAGDWAVACFLLAAVGANILNDPEPSEEEKEAESAREGEEERKRMLSFSVGAFLTALLLAFLALGAAALMLGFIDRNEDERLFFYVLVPLFFLRLLLGIAIAMWRDVNDTDDLFDQGLLIGLARIALFVGAIAVSHFAMPGGRSLASYFILLVGGGLLFALFYAGRRVVDHVFARTTYDPPYPAALGLMLLGGAGLLVADLIATTSR